MSKTTAEQTGHAGVSKAGRAGVRRAAIRQSTSQCLYSDAVMSFPVFTAY